MNGGEEDNAITKYRGLLLFVPKKTMGKSIVMAKNKVAKAPGIAAERPLPPTNKTQQVDDVEDFKGRVSKTIWNRIKRNKDQKKASEPPAMVPASSWTSSSSSDATQEEEEVLPISREHRKSTPCNVARKLEGMWLPKWLRLIFDLLLFVSHFPSFASHRPILCCTNSHLPRWAPARQPPRRSNSFGRSGISSPSANWPQLRGFLCCPSPHVDEEQRRICTHGRNVRKDSLWTVEELQQLRPQLCLGRNRQLANAYSRGGWPCRGSDQQEARQTVWLGVKTACLSAKESIRNAVHILLSWLSKFLLASSTLLVKPKLCGLHF